MTKCCWSPPLNFTSSTSFSLSMMSPFGLNVWQGQWTLISKPKLLPDGKQLRKRGLSDFLNRIQQSPFLKFNIQYNKSMRWSLGLMTALETNDNDLSLTSVHQPFPHCFSHIKGDPFWSTSGQHILGSNVALFPNVFIWPYNLQGKNMVTFKGFLSILKQLKQNNK